MDNNIGIGLLVGVIIATSTYVWNSTKFTKVQKTFLIVCALFAPIQWVLIPIILFYNKMQKETSKEFKTEQKLNNTSESLYQLKEKGILTEEEYKTKVRKVETEKAQENLKNSIEYKQLKSLLDSGVLTNQEFQNKVGFLSEKYFKVKTQDFRVVDGFSEGYGLAINSDLDYGFVDEDGRTLIDFKFEHAENFKNGIAKVRDNGEFKKIDKQGNFI